jgi:hypothetical protein
MEKKAKKVDITNAIQTTELKDSTIYMSIPEEFKFLHPEIDNHNFLLWYNAINGLKQSGHDFNKKFDDIIKKIGFKRSFMSIRPTETR